MTDHLRRIALTVEEPGPGRFHWVLLESLEDASGWNELAASSRAYPEWIDAINFGNNALMAMARDRRVGPRSQGEDEDASPVGEA
jgi:hypothetical protein